MLVTTTPDFIPEPETVGLAQAKHFVDSCLGHVSPISIPSDSMEVTKIIEKIYESSLN